MRQKGARGDKEQRGTEPPAKEKIGRLLREADRRMQNVGSRAVVADYIRLMQLEHELEQDEGATEIKVTWVEPRNAEHSEE